MVSFEIKICGGINCSTRGGQELLDVLEEDPLLQKYCKFEVVECLNGCEDGYGSPVIEINGTLYQRMTPERLIDFISNKVNSS